MASAADSGTGSLTSASDLPDIACWLSSPKQVLLSELMVVMVGGLFVVAFSAGDCRSGGVWALPGHFSKARFHARIECRNAGCGGLWNEHVLNE